MRSFGRLCKVVETAIKDPQLYWTWALKQSRSEPRDPQHSSPVEQHCPGGAGCLSQVRPSMRRAERESDRQTAQAFPMMDSGLGLTLPVPTLPGAVGLVTVAASENVCACCGEPLHQECGTDPLKPAETMEVRERGRKSSRLRVKY